MDSARLRQLAADLQADREDLDQVLGEAAQCLADLSDRAPTYLELRGAGDIVHDFYNAVEHVFERVAVELNGGLPAGLDSHAQLLRRMSHGVDKVRPAVIDESLRRSLHAYLRFRHLFRHGYGFALEWAKLLALLEGIQQVSMELRRQLDAFVATVGALADRLE